MKMIDLISRVFWPNFIYIFVIGKNEAEHLIRYFRNLPNKHQQSAAEKNTVA